MSSYTTGIPTPGQSLGITQKPILDNFSVLNTTIAQDHIAMNTTGAGKHKVIHIPNPQTVGTSPGSGALEWNIYTKSLASGSVEVFYQRPGAAANGPDIQMTTLVTTGESVPTGSPAVNASSRQYVTFLPAGLVMISGYIVSAGATQQVNYPITFTALYSIQLTRLFTSGPSNRSFHQVTISDFTSFTFRNLDANGSADSGFSVFYQVVGTK